MNVLTYLCPEDLKRSVPIRVEKSADCTLAARPAPSAAAEGLVIEDLMQACIKTVRINFSSRAEPRPMTHTPWSYILRT